MNARLIQYVLLGFCACWLTCFEAQADTPPQIGWDRIHISGLGWQSNRQLKQALSVVSNNESQTLLLSTSTLEDIFLVLKNEVIQIGYLQPKFEYTLIYEGGTATQLDWQTAHAAPIFSAKSHRPVKTLDIKVIPGKLYYYEDIQINGLPNMSAEKIRSFFHPTGQWIVSKRDRYFTPGRLKQSLQSIRNFLQEAGYRNAEIVNESFDVDDTTGAVTVQAAFATGPQHWIAHVRIQTDADPPPEHPFHPTLSLPTLLSPSWLSKYMYTVRRHYQSYGYVDIETNAFFKEVNANEDKIYLDLEIQVQPGPVKYVGTVTLSGPERLDTEFIAQQLNVHSGQLFDPTKVEQTREYLQRLRLFKSIDVEYIDADASSRDIIFKLKPQSRDRITLIGGIGSYDIVRTGVQWDRMNLWGRAHRTELQVLQSLRMSQVEYNYTIPQLWGSDVNVFTNTHALFREEISFERQEWGMRIGGSFPWKKHNTQLTVQYKYERLAVIGQDFLPEDGLEEATVSSLEFRIRKNELDNPILPSAGYQLFASLELALPAVGGEVEYQRLECGGAYHHSFTDGLIGRLGLRHGLITSFDKSTTNIPFNRRFFLGGEHSVRGYRDGEASPLDAQGKEIGATAYTLLQLEIEQQLNQSLSLVVFTDSAGLSENSDAYLSPQWLHSVGVGMRLRTFLGPLRFEYAHNINPREVDPHGSFQVGLGLPF